MEFFLFLPQMRMSFDRLVASAQAAEAAGFTGVAGMDHMMPTGAESHPMYEAMITNTWLAAHTTRLIISSLVLCDAFRLPGVLAKEAVSIDHASGGRFELAIGWGSYLHDFEHYGILPSQPRERVQRLRETLEVLKALWSGETVTYNGQYHKLDGAFQAPQPLGKIPIVIGGSGPKTLALVRDFADWWNLDTRYIDKLHGDQFKELTSQIGKARVSIQQMGAYIAPGADRVAITELTMRRFSWSKPLIGTGPEMLDHFSREAERGIERVYLWMADFAQPDTLAGFGEEVIAKMPVAALVS
jgi:alkanesulfonate monooxygenase SsuD/methylene tetrahydromethanopterin reductase-like flavin-dependent oxidoreductase (luciferase family)